VVIFDYLVVGNGAIGTLSAIQLKKRYPMANIGLVGDANRVNGASVAAGAMCNVFAEVEYPFSDNHKKLIDLSLWYGILGREGWLDLFSTGVEFQSLKTATDTMVFLKPDASDFEQKNYRSAKEVAAANEVMQNVTVGGIGNLFKNAETLPLDAFKIDGEFAIDTRELFRILNKWCTELGIKILNQIIVEIDTSKSVVITETSKINYDRLVVALGANSSALLPKGTIQSVIQGVGTAIEIREKVWGGNFTPEGNLVIRTVNRGGAQCGFHFVPRRSGYYLGAGNYIMSTGNSDHRLETIRYLFNTFEKEVCGSDFSYLLEGNLVKGHRPRALDGFPLIGPLKAFPNIFIASGTNRAGLTWAPKIANQVITWSNGEVEDFEFSPLVNPNRVEIDFGSEEEAINYYCESRIAAALEHQKIQGSDKSIKLERLRVREYAQKLLADVRIANSDLLSVPHPDHWALIVEKPSICHV